MQNYLLDFPAFEFPTQVYVELMMQDGTKLSSQWSVSPYDFISTAHGSFAISKREHLLDKN